MQYFVKYRCPWKRIVIKRAGLAGGKGVFIADNKEDAKKTLKDLMKKDKTEVEEKPEKIVLEEYMDGYEISVSL